MRGNISATLALVSVDGVLHSFGEIFISTCGASHRRIYECVSIIVNISIYASISVLRDNYYIAPYVVSIRYSYRLKFNDLDILLLLFAAHGGYNTDHITLG